MKVQHALPVLKAAHVCRVYINCTVIDLRSSAAQQWTSQLYPRPPGGRWGTCGTRDGSREGSIDNTPTVRLSRGANCIWRCSYCPRWHGMTAVVLSCTRAPLVSAHCSLSPDDVLGVLGWVHVCWVVSRCQC